MGITPMTMTPDTAGEVVAAARFLGFRPTGPVQSTAAMATAAGGDPVAAVADACDLVARRVVLPPDWYDDSGPPALVRPEHGGTPYTIAYRRGWRRLRGGERLSRSDAAGLDRHAVEFLPRLPPTPSSLRELRRRCLAGTGSDWLVLAVTTAVAAAGAFLTPVLLGQVAASVAGTAPRNTGAAAILVLLLLAASLAFMSTIRVTAISRLRTRLTGRVTAMLFSRAVRAPLSFHNTIAPSRRTRMTLVGGRASGELGDDIVLRVLDSVIVLAAVVAVATTTPLLTLGVVVALAVEALLLGLLVRGAGDRAVVTADRARAAGSALDELLGEQTELRVWRAQRRFAARWWALLHELTDAQQGVRRRAAARDVIAAAWPVVVLAVIVAVSSVTTVSFSDFVTAQTAGLVAAMAVGPLMAAVDASLRARALVRRAEPIVGQAAERTGDPLPAVRGAVVLEDLTVAATADGTPVLAGIDLVVPAGQFVVVAGRVGAGSSTLLQTLLGLLTPAAGRVLVEDLDVTEIAPHLRRLTGALVQQQADALLPGTIRDNVAMGRPVGGRMVRRALDEVGATEWVHRLGLGIETATTNEGRRLSATQRQQILLARALVGDPPLLVLDTPVRDLSGPALERVVATLADRSATRIVATRHRRLAAAADHVVILADGGIVAAGPASELTRTSAAYRAVFGG